MNKHILLVMKWLDNPESVTQEELKENAWAADDATDDTHTDSYDAYAASYAAAYATRKAYYATYWLSRYFETTGEAKQDYLEELNK